jgi:hypothetical protein
MTEIRSAAPSRAKDPAPITLNIKDVLIAARKAFDAGELSIQTGKASCTYAGPCAIGAAIPPERRAALDKDYPTISALVERGVVQVEGVGLDDMVCLQAAHDECTVAGFAATLSDLEIQHGLRPAGESGTGRLGTQNSPEATQ